MSLKQQVQNPAVQPPATATSVDAAAEPLHQRGPREKAQERIERPLRAGVFSDVAAADRVVESLVQSGFAPEEITVVCSEESVQLHFQEFGHEKPAGTFTPAAAAAGSVIGATLGGLAAIVGGVTTGGIALWSGGIVGGLVGAMLTRGVEPELANFYDQAVTQGKILVAVHTMEGTADPARLRLADEIIRACGAESMPLPIG